MNPEKRSILSPWGLGGCLWRTFLFLLGMALICWILSLIRGCSNQEEGAEDERYPGEELPVAVRDLPYGEDPEAPYGRDPKTGLPVDRDGRVIDDDYEDPYREYRNTSPVREWRDTIADVPELPDPRDNYITPIDERKIITDPNDSISQIIQDELVVLFNSQDVKADMTKFAQRFKQEYPGNGYEISYYNPTAGTMLIRVPEDQRDIVARELNQKIPDIKFIVTTNEIMNTWGKPSDPGFKDSYNNEYFELIQAYDAWDVTKGSQDIKVAIVDSYFDLTNPEIGERYVNPIHIPTKTGDVLPPARAPLSPEEFGSWAHGSHVAGLAIGGQDNGMGASGLAPKVTWIPISLGDQLTKFNVIEGILYAINQGADVVNFSIGKALPKDIDKILPLADQIEIALNENLEQQALWKQVIEIANDHNCVLVTSAGNSTALMGLDAKNRNDGIIKVEAVDEKGIMADFSNYGKVPEDDLDYSTVAAPGVDVWSVAVPQAAPLARQMQYRVSSDGRFQDMSGTSMAAPIVAGAVALLKSKNPDLTNEEVIKILTATAKQTDTEHRIGPTIQVKDALDMVGGEKLNFDDLMKDHNLIVGTWKSTYVINLVKTDTNEKLDEMWFYFTFVTPDRGYVEYKCIERKSVYRTDFTVSWGKDSLTVRLNGRPVDGNGNDILKDDYVFRPDQNRYLEASAQRNGKERFKFLLEKVK